MEIKILVILYLKKICKILGVIFCIFTIACSAVRNHQSTSFFKFNYDGYSYRIRSISAEDKSVACNELIGKKVLARDFDKDTIIDQVSLGEMDLPEAQKIYEFGLNILQSENKLHEIDAKIQSFQFVNEQYNYEIKSFRPNKGSPFNQFIIFNKYKDLNPQIIFIDENADGSLDKILKGDISTEQFQALYSDAIKEGLQKNKLINVGSMILINEN